MHMRNCYLKGYVCRDPCHMRSIHFKCAICTWCEAATTNNLQYYFLSVNLLIDSMSVHCSPSLSDKGFVDCQKAVWQSKAEIISKTVLQIHAVFEPMHERSHTSVMCQYHLVDGSALKHRSKPDFRHILDEKRPKCCAHECLRCIV